MPLRRIPFEDWRFTAERLAAVRARFFEPLKLFDCPFGKFSFCPHDGISQGEARVFLHEHIHTVQRFRKLGDACMRPPAPALQDQKKYWEIDVSILFLTKKIFSLNFGRGRYTLKFRKFQ